MLSDSNETEAIDLNKSAGMKTRNTRLEKRLAEASSTQPSHATRIPTDTIRKT